MPYSSSEFKTIYLRCFPPCMRMAICLLHSEDEARDTVQESFLKLWETDMDVINPDAFLIRSVRNACINRINSASTRERIRKQLPVGPIIEETDIERRDEEVREAVDRLLTGRERQVVDKIYSEGLSYKEAAESLDVSVATINKNIVAALKKLRIHFKTRKP